MGREIHNKILYTIAKYQKPSTVQNGINLNNNKKVK